MLSFSEQLASASRRLTEAVDRIRALSGAARQADQNEALLFNLERAAWASLELAQAWVFELRLGIPRKETDCFDLLQRHGRIDLETTRRYKQLCEFRSLSARPADRIDWSYLQGDLRPETDLFLEWNGQSRLWKQNHP